jgi:hypothetical protein
VFKREGYMTEGKKWWWWAGKIFTVVGSLAIAALLYLVLGDSDDGSVTGLSNPFIRTGVCVGLCMFAFCYAYVYDGWLTKMSSGCVQIAAALWNDWYQLGKIGSEPSAGLSERIVFLIVGIALLTHGMADILKGLEGKKLYKPIRQI